MARQYLASCDKCGCTVPDGQGWERECVRGEIHLLRHSQIDQQLGINEWCKHPANGNPTSGAQKAVILWGIAPNKTVPSNTYCLCVECQDKLIAYIGEWFK